MVAMVMSAENEIRMSSFAGEQQRRSSSRRIGRKIRVNVNNPLAELENKTVLTHPPENGRSVRNLGFRNAVKQLLMF